MKSHSFELIVALVCAFTMSLVAADTPSVRLMTLDPGHFHAGLVQKFMYPQVSPLVHVYAPAGPDLDEHLKRIDGFNKRAENPTRWEEKVYTGSDFVERMLKDRPGNVVVLSGNNARKTEYIERAVRAGLNVLADKPMAITPSGFKLLRKAFTTAERKNVLLYDIMTERFEVTSILQRELARASEVFGSLEKGTPEDPAIVMESVHHFFKEVAGKPLLRPAWFYDVRQQGEAIPDVGTHLIDLVQWQAFPDQALDWRKDVKVYGARRWPTKMTPEQFKRSTGLATYPEFLKRDIGPDGQLNVFQNQDVSYALRGVHAKVTALWNFEAPPGVKDTHYALMRGTRASLRIRQGPEQRYNPVLYVEKRTSGSAEDFDQKLNAVIQRLNTSWPGVSVKRAGETWEIVVPEKYAVGHEAHFAQVTDNYLKYLAAGRLPDWEVPNMLTKYFTTTEAFRLAHSARASK